MQRNAILAFGITATLGAVVGVGCSYSQPAFECTFLAPYWAKYTLVEGTGSCSEYTGDIIGAQRFLPPGASEMTMALLPRRISMVTRSTPNGETRWVDAVDNTLQHESARGTFSSLYADGQGVCTAQSSITPGDEALPAVSLALADGGVEVTPATHVRHEWSNFRLLNTARFAGTAISADLTITEDSCTAKYHIEGIAPIVACETDGQCNPEPSEESGPTGSGMKIEYFKDGKPVCTHLVAGSSEADIASDYVGDPVTGLCLPTVSFDDLVNMN